MIYFEKEVIGYLNLPNIPKKQWDGKSSFVDGVAVVRLAQDKKAYAVCTYDNERDNAPRIKKYFGQESFEGIEDIFVVPSYMDVELKDADLDAESIKKARLLSNEALELESEGVGSETPASESLPEWIFPEINNKEEAQAWLRRYNQSNKIKKGKVPSNEETLKLRLYSIYMEMQKKQK